MPRANLGIGAAALDTIGLQAREWAFVGLNGRDIYAEPRGLLVGYNWPQYAVHRGHLQMLLYETVQQRLGPSAVRLGQHVVAYETHGDGVVVTIEHADGRQAK
jgi:5-methylphenazine-1-carboxylate 1-monooxygenase